MNTHDDDGDDGADEGEDEVVVGAEPTHFAGPVAEGVDDGTHCHHHRREPVSGGVVPASPRLLRLKHLHQHHVQLEPCRKHRQRKRKGQGEPQGPGSHKIFPRGTEREINPSRV